MRRALIPGLLLLAAAALPAAAQESGGLNLSQEALAVGGPRGLARPLRMTFPGFTASDLQTTPTPAERRLRHQDMIARVRGDGGFLEGFAFGQPRAASRRPPPPPVDPIFAPIFIDQRTKVVNTFDGPVAVTVGNNNIVQQQGAKGGDGPTAQQQVATVGGRSQGGPRSGGGATNLVTADGNIVQGTGGAAGARRGAR
jgi:hypothetical protein